jgi:serine/threonine-protein kinase
VEKLKKVNEEHSPNVVKILNSGITETGNFPFIEMEFIEGPDLEELLKPPHASIFTIKETLKVAEQLSSALAHCHKVNVKHGDIKSNNVKFNVNTGNYVLLDFGLAIMSDEERRTSLRHAGAIEFMAPEQNEGRMYFETDVYSFGVVLFELLAGTVPFPLLDKGETARNNVMLAHMETPPPNIFTLRGKALPAEWSDEMKEAEMQIPEWMFTMIYRCLQKKPEARFASGMALNEFISRNSLWTAAKKSSPEQIKLLQEENQRLLQQNRDLQNELAQLRKSNKKNTGSQTVFTDLNSGGEIPVQPKKKFSALRAFFWILLGIFVTAIFAYAVMNFSTKKNIATNQRTTKIIADTINELTEQAQADINNQLQNAKTLLAENKRDEALAIYAQLSQQNIPQAMFQYANLALQNKNSNLDCAQAFNLLKMASDKDYLPAKTTLGFLYAFADNDNLMKEHNYFTRCFFVKNAYKGAALLTEATMEGDFTAAYWLDKLNNAGK